MIAVLSLATSLVAPAPALRFAPPVVAPRAARFAPVRNVAAAAHALLHVLVNAAMDERGADDAIAALRLGTLSSATLQALSMFYSKQVVRRFSVARPKNSLAAGFDFGVLDNVGALRACYPSEAEQLLLAERQQLQQELELRELAEMELHGAVEGLQLELERLRAQLRDQPPPPQPGPEADAERPQDRASSSVRGGRVETEASTIGIPEFLGFLDPHPQTA